MKKLYKIIYYDKIISNTINCNVYVIAENEKEALSKSLKKMKKPGYDYPVWDDLKTQVILVADEKGNNNDYIIL